MRQLISCLLLAFSLCGIANAQGSKDPHAIRRPEVTSTTLALTPPLTGENVLEFKLLEATKIGKEPPPNFLKRVRAMDGKKVKLRGFMVPYDSLTDMKRCMVMPTPVGCFFCSPPAPTQVVLIRLATKDRTPFIPEPLDVEGTLNLWKPSSSDEGHKQFLFILDDSVVTKAG